MENDLEVYRKDIIREMLERGRYCEWCREPLPDSEGYHLRICPKCRKETIDAVLRGETPPLPEQEPIQRVGPDGVTYEIKFEKPVKKRLSKRYSKV